MSKRRHWPRWAQSITFLVSGHAGRSHRFFVGSARAARRQTRALRIIFAFVISGLGIEMIYNGWTGKL
jgi:hypothetical protein